jgi:S-formylglutathione hydrolase
LPHLLGPDSDSWRAEDATDLVSQRQFPSTLRIDYGTADRHLDTHLKPHLFEAACKAAGQPLDLRRHDGYDHCYSFVSTFVEAHLRHHAAALMG